MVQLRVVNSHAQEVLLRVQRYREYQVRQRVQWFKDAQDFAVAIGARALLTQMTDEQWARRHCANDDVFSVVLDAIGEVSG